MADKAYVQLEPSEAALVRAASNILSGYIAAGKVNEENESEMMKKAIKSAINIALKVDDLVQSDSELG
ncbi:MAG: hypothetical protein ACLFWL_17765 [Candidatus Brocadiia bacterium]